MQAAPQSSADPGDPEPLMRPAEDSARATQPLPVASAPLAGPAAPPAAPARIDREFVVKNRLVERYIGGRLPVRGAQDLERFCCEHPELLDEIQLTQNIQSAVRLLDLSGQRSPWEPEPKKWWQRPQIPIAIGLLAIALACLAMVLNVHIGQRDRAIAGLKQTIASQPLDPATSTRSITVSPSRVAPSRRSLLTIGGGGSAQMADLKIDVSWSAFKEFRVTIDRLDQGRVAILHNLMRDSNGAIHIELNSSALGPGDYQLTLEGLNWKGEPSPQAWATLSILH